MPKLCFNLFKFILSAMTILTLAFVGPWIGALGMLYIKETDNPILTDTLIPSVILFVTTLAMLTWSGSRSLRVFWLLVYFGYLASNWVIIAFHESAQDHPDTNEELKETLLIVTILVVILVFLPGFVVVIKKNGKNDSNQDCTRCSSQTESGPILRLKSDEDEFREEPRFLRAY
jgi:hypothetical protein